MSISFLTRANSLLTPNLKSILQGANVWYKKSQYNIPVGFIHNCIAYSEF